LTSHEHSWMSLYWCLHEFRLAGKKFGHPARNEKNELEKVRRNKPKITEMLSGKIYNREIAALWKLVVWASGHDDDR